MIKLTHVPFSRSVRQYFVDRNYDIACARSDWKFSFERWQMIRREYADWKKHYLPIDVRGKIVLDVGAGEGETAKFYLENGAKKVLAIELSPTRYRYLIGNSKGRNILPVPRPFAVEDLFDLDYDFAKIDIEGWEEELLDYREFPKPMVLEVHGLQLQRYFKDAGFRVVEGVPSEWTGYAYWEC